MAPPPVVQLACQSCQSKKLKCDKGNPCSNCERAGATCQPVTRSRLPRGRNGGRKGGSDDLRDRVKRLEALVRGQITTKAEPASSKPSPSPGTGPTAERDSVPMKYLGSTFWATLCNEVESLRDVLSEEIPEDVSDPPTPPQPKGDQATSIFNFVLCSPTSFMLTPGALRHPPRPAVNKLCELFLQYVDPIVKVAHAPFIRKLLLQGEHYMGLPPDSPSVQSLCYAVYYSAVNTLDAPSCFMEFGEAKQPLLQRLRFSLEVFLARADFVNANDLPTLQAFVLFLAAHRTNDTSRTTWALLGLAVRIGQAMGLHHEPPPSVGVFEREMRRRLWHAICLIDAQGSMDRGTEPIVNLGSFTTQQPLNVSDCDLSPELTVAPSIPDTYTDMSFFSMAVDASVLFRQFFTFRGPGAADTWEARLEIARRTEETFETKYVSKCDPTIAMQSCTQRIGRSMETTAYLMLGRPMHRTLVLPPVHEKYKYLNLAVDLLRQYNDMHDDPSIQRWLWFLWLPWHALAVALAELCVLDQNEVILQAWPIVQRAYDTFEEFVADSSTGLLWQPIQKLMRKAQQRSRSKRHAGKQPKHRSSVQMQDMELGVQQYSPFSADQSLQVSPNEMDLAYATGSRNTMDTTYATPPEDQAWQNWELFLDDMMSTNDFSVDASSYEAWSGQTGMQI